MGCDIYSYVEVRRDGRWHHATGDLFPDNDDRPDTPFPYRSYRLFGFLADVRNRSESPVICRPRGLPDDLSAEVDQKYGPRGTSVWDAPGWNSASWLTVAELLGHDYEQKFVDQHPYGDDDPHTTLRDFLGEGYFDRLTQLAALADDPADVRVVFWFDN